MECLRCTRNLREDDPGKLELLLPDDTVRDDFFPDQMLYLCLCGVFCYSSICLLDLDVTNTASLLFSQGPVQTSLESSIMLSPNYL